MYEIQYIFDYQVGCNIFLNDLTNTTCIGNKPVLGHWGGLWREGILRHQRQVHWCCHAKNAREV